MKNKLIIALVGLVFIIPHFTIAQVNSGAPDSGCKSTSGYSVTTGLPCSVPIQITTTNNPLPLCNGRPMYSPDTGTQLCINSASDITVSTTTTDSNPGCTGWNVYNLTTGALCPPTIHNTPTDLVVTSPTDGKTFKLGDEVTVTWKSSNLSSNDSISIALMSIPDNNLLFVRPNGIVTKNTGSATFALPYSFNTDPVISDKILNGQFYIRLLGPQKSYSTVLPEAVSPLFKISHCTDFCRQERIKITAPSTNDTYVSGDKVSIKWDTFGMPSDSDILITLSPDDQSPIYQSKVSMNDLAKTPVFSYVMRTKNTGSAIITLPSKNLFGDFLKPGSDIFMNKYKLWFHYYYIKSNHSASEEKSFAEYPVNLNSFSKGPFMSSPVFTDAIYGNSNPFTINPGDSSSETEKQIAIDEQYSLQLTDTCTSGYSPITGLLCKKPLNDRSIPTNTVQQIIIQPTNINNVTITDSKRAMQLPAPVNQNQISTPPNSVTPQTSTTCTDITQNLRFGMKDSTTTDVLRLQNFLSEKGFLKVAPTGYFGKMTLQASIDFQTANNISPTGFVGPLTKTKINEMACAQTTRN